MKISLVTWPAVAIVAGVFIGAIVLLVRAARRGTWLLSVRSAVWALIGVTGLALVLHGSRLFTTRLWPSRTKPPVTGARQAPASRATSDNVHKDPDRQPR